MYIYSVVFYAKLINVKEDTSGSLNDNETDLEIMFDKNQTSIFNF